MGTYLANAGFMLIILGMVLMRTVTTIHQPQSRIRCINLIIVTMLYVIIDAAFIACDLMQPDVRIFQVVVFLFYVIYVTLPFIWHRFVLNFVNTPFFTVAKKLEYVPFVILLGLVIATPFTGALWTIASDYTYIRGPLFTVYTYLNYFYYLEPLGYAILIGTYKDHKPEPYLRHAVLISFVPLVGAMINNIVIPAYQIYPFQPFCSVVVALLAYFFIAATESDILQEQNQKAIEESLRQAREATDRATEASRVKTNFLSNMSHDIRTPMNAIINLTELAEREDDINVVREYLGKMEISGKFLLGLINDILDMSKIESGELTLHKENMTRTEFLNTVETVICPLMESRHIHFHSELNPGKYTISVDKLRFNQIFFNLLSNAAKFTPEGGDVWFEVTNLEAKNDRLKIKFVVRDNGIGMSEDFLQHLFEPFAREHNDAMGMTQGTGLGLPIVKSLVTAMGGTISVKSKLGEGTEFVVLFDVDIVSRDELTSDAAPHESVSASLNGMRILLVEDNDVNTYVAQLILENAGCIVTTAENGKVALDKYAESEPFSFDAVLMDIRMPVMDGIESAQKIRALPRPDVAVLPIIAMTADAFDEERKKTLDAGMDYHLAKPVDANKIYEVLAECGGRIREAAKSAGK